MLKGDALRGRGREGNLHTLLTSVQVLHKLTQLGPEAFSNPAEMDDLFKQARIAELHGTAEIADHHIRDPKVCPAYICNRTYPRPG